MKKCTSAIIVGTGSHSKAVISLLKRNNSFHIKGLLDTSKNFDINEKIMNYPVIGSINNFEEILSIDKFVFFVAIGDNYKRREIFNYLNKKKGSIAESL